MARFIRASLLLIALGAVSSVAVLPAVASAANAGGAAPGSEAVAAPANGSTGGAAPGESSAPRSVSSSSTGGALAGQEPAAAKAKRKRAARRAALRRAAVRRAALRRAAQRRAAQRRAVQRKARRQQRPAPGTSPSETPAPAPDPEVPLVDGVFPVQGPYSLGGDGSRFGADRSTHRHQGQDVSATSGTPLVSPVAGTVTWKANQPGGAGIYLIVRGTADERDYVFMHLKRGSLLVDVGDVVAAGQQIAGVGSTGSSSGPHLHFEIWVGGWQTRGGRPIDPLPQLLHWAGS